MLAARETRGIVDPNTGRLSIIVEHDYNGGIRLGMVDKPTPGAVTGIWHEFNSFAQRPAAFGHFCRAIEKASDEGWAYL